MPLKEISSRFRHETAGRAAVGMAIVRAFAGQGSRVGFLDFVVT